MVLPMVHCSRPTAAPSTAETGSDGTNCDAPDFITGSVQTCWFDRDGLDVLDGFPQNQTIAVGPSQTPQWHRWITGGHYISESGGPRASSVASVSRVTSLVDFRQEQRPLWRFVDIRHCSRQTVIVRAFARFGGTARSGEGWFVGMALRQADVSLFLGIAATTSVRAHRRACRSAQTLPLQQRAPRSNFR